MEVVVNDLMRLNRHRITLFVLAIASILGTGIYFHSNLRRFPEYTVSRNFFYGYNNSNLKDYVKEGDELTSQSADAWVSVPVNDTLGIYEIAINVRNVSIDWNWAQIFIGGDWESADTVIHPGINYFKFGKQVEPKHIPYIRFDLTAEPSVSLCVDSIVINPHRHMIMEWLKDLSVIIAVGAAVCSSLFSIYRRYGQLKQGNSSARYAAIISALLQIIVFAGAGYRYIRLGYIDQQLLFLIVSLICESILCCILLWKSSRKKWLYPLMWLLYGGMAFMFIEAISGAPITSFKLHVIVYNVLICAVPCMVLFCLFGSRRITWILPGIFWLVIAVVNHFYYVFRGQAFELIDLKMAGTAMTVIKNYRFELFVVLDVIIAEVAALVLATVLKTQGPRIRRRERIAAGILAIMLAVLIMNHLPGVSLWNTDETTRSYGYPFSFAAYAKKSFQRPVPEGYSAKEVERILARYSETGADGVIAENVIVIMNEAFSDLPEAYGFNTDTDCMPYIHSLSGKNVAKGNILVSVFGGTTSNTEYEFLTGNSMAFLNTGDVPYVQYISHDIPSFARLLYNQGFSVEAFHPYSDRGYKRYLVYPLLGFDEFYTQDDELISRELIRNYISDSADYKNVIHYDSQNSSDHWFMFNVTMQNHGGYSTGTSNVTTTVRPLDADLQMSSLEEYLSLIRESDRAFQELIEYYASSPEKTIILMFGDHQPGLDSAAFDTINSKAPAIEDWKEQEDRKYTVPYVMWANYELPEEMPKLTSPNYLRVLLMREAGIPLSSYDQLVYDCFREYPAINIVGFIDKEGVLYDISELDSNELLMDYKKCAYYNLFEEGNLDWDYFQ